jgi:hypothetical protein
MAKKMRNLLVMAKEQTAFGTPATLAANQNAILTRSAMPSPIKATFTERGLVRPYFGNSDKVVSGEHAMLEFEVELAGSGTAGTAPALAPLLIGCGFAQTLSAGVSAAYNLVTPGYKFLTLACNLDGIQFLLTDALLDVSCEMNPKGIPVLKFTSIGKYNPPTDTSMPVNASFAAFMKPLAVSRTNTPTFTLHGTSPCVEAFSWALGNEQGWRERINCNGAERTDRKTTANLTIELPTVASRNWAETTRLGTSGALQVIHGTAAGHIVQIDAPNATVGSEPTISDSEGDAMLGLQLDLNPTTGNNELVLTFR